MSSTLKDISKRANVSISTVSRALQNHPRISLVVRTQIQEIAKELNYIPNASAINLKKRFTKTLGVVVPEINLSFFSLILSGMDHAATLADYNLLITQSAENKQREWNQVLNLYKANVDGILIAPSKQTSDYGFLHELKKNGFPVVMFSRTHPDFNGVNSNDYEGAQLATQHLIDIGCKRIAHIAGPWHLKHTHERLEGYINAQKINSITPQIEHIAYSNLDKESTLEAIYRLLELEKKPDAFFCFNDYIAFDVIEVLKTKCQNRPLPFVVGYANEPISRYMDPTLTSIDQNAFQIGVKTIELMIETIAHSNPNLQIKTIQLETTLIKRNSTLMSNLD